MKRTISEDQVIAAVSGEDLPAVPEAARRPLRELMDDRLLDALLERSRDQAGGLRLTGECSMLGELVRAVLERALESELTAHLGYAKGGRGDAGGNARNGNIAKTVQTGVGPVPLQVPRDRAGSFEPVLVPKRSGRVASRRWRSVRVTARRATAPACALITAAPGPARPEAVSAAMTPPPAPALGLGRAPAPSSFRPVVARNTSSRVGWWSWSAAMRRLAWSRARTSSASCRSPSGSGTVSPGLVADGGGEAFEGS